MSAQSTPVADRIREIPNDECWRLLQTQSLGRLAVLTGATVDIFPVNYLVYDRAIYFRTAAGSKLAHLNAHPQVAFEVDHAPARHAWSVVVHGHVNVLSTEKEILESGIHELLTDHPSDKFHYVRIVADAVSGRSFARRTGLW